LINLTLLIETIKHPFQEFTNELEINLENRLAIVEELKELINPQENIKDTKSTMS
jgi:hypothetical protein